MMRPRADARFRMQPGVLRGFCVAIVDSVAAEAATTKSAQAPHNRAMHPWRERLARWFTPMARWMPLSPNAITLIALFLNIVAGICLAFGARRPALFLVAIVFIAISGIADALDGIVARVQEKSSRFCDFLDH